MHSTENVTLSMDGTPVPISQYKNEFERLLLLYYMHNPLRVLEIGTHYGGTLYHWLKNANEAAIIVAIDDHHINGYMYEEWQKEKQIVVALHGRSQHRDVINEAKRYAPYDFIFIDGGHSYEEVKQDWLNYSPMTNKDRLSIVAFHDILPHPHAEVSKLWAHLLDLQLYNTMTFISEENQDGCGIGVIFL